MTKLPKQVRGVFSDKNLEINPKFQNKLKAQLFKGDTMTKTTKTLSKSLFSTKYFMPAGVALALVATVGIGSYLYSQNKTESAVLREVALPSDLSGLKSVDEIRGFATVGLVQGVSISSVELELEENVLVYKVKFTNGTFKLYNARTGEMVAKSDLEIDASVPADFVAGVTIESARATAQGVFPDKTIVKIELETEEQVVVYSVRFSDDSRVDVSAVDGSIVRSRNELTDERTGGDDSSDGRNDSGERDEEITGNDDDRSGGNSGSSGNSGRGSDDSERN
jgi:uncharacterized membrane protein YkoI